MNLATCLGIGGTALVGAFALVQVVRMVAGWLRSDDPLEGEQ